MRKKKNGTLIVNRFLKTPRSLLSGVLVCTCGVFKIHSNEMCVCTHTRWMCTSVYVTISVAFPGVWNILINQAVLSLYYINQTINVNGFNFSLFIFLCGGET